MSGGELQRAGIARALASNPRVIFLDEPSSALDMSIRGQIINLLLDLQSEQGLAYVLVSHDMRVVAAMADYLLVMYLGHVVEQGPVDQVLHGPLHPYTKGLLNATLLGTEERPAVRIRGEVLQLPAGYNGCRFYRRCPFALDPCKEPQMLWDLTPGHAARCWRAEQIIELEARERVPVA